MAARKPIAKKAARKKTALSKSAPKMAAKRDDLGASTDRYFAEQAPEKRALLEELRALVMKGVPDAQSSLKWGVPFYQRNGKSICSLAAFKEHVGINFFAPPSVLVDPKKKLEGGGKTMRMLKVRSPEDIDSASIQRWLKATVAAAG
ncbi:MAG: DUF1801 domain-containing protein [Candidatus Limnocylindria bacterium]